MKVIDLSVDSMVTVELEHVYAIGVFDGVHVGHQEIIRTAQSRARQLGVRSGVVTLDPHPSVVVGSGQIDLSLMPLQERLEIIDEMSIDTAVVLRFDRKLASMSAYSFAKEVLVDRLRIAAAVVGENHSFGRGAEGNAAELRRIGVDLGFDVEVVAPFAIDGTVVSSTLIRNLVASGDVAQAGKYLGRPFRMRGVVVEGNHLGKQLGFPTMNIYPQEEQVVPARGVYLSTVTIEGDQQQRWGICNVGLKPTVPTDRLVVEIHVLDYDEQVYGRTIEISFLSYLRGERRFSSLDELKAAIASDERAARRWIADKDRCRI